MIETSHCYTEDWRRTKPDLVMYLPSRPGGNDVENEHVLIVVTPKGDLFATWVQASYECAPDNRTVYSHSTDGGQTWSRPSLLDPHEDRPSMSPRWAFTIVSKTGRMYCFYNKFTGITDSVHSLTGIMRCAFSDDDGHTWQDAGEIPFRRRKFDHPDPMVPCNWIVWQSPIRDRKGRWLAAFTRWSSFQVMPEPRDGRSLDSRSELMRFDNIDQGVHPKDLAITWLPEDESISVPNPFEADNPVGYSLGEEPAVVLLPDGGLFLVMRTVTGRVWYTVSDDDGAHWRPSEPLRFRDGGAEVLHPKDTSPLFRLSDGRYLLFFHNHDGSKYGGTDARSMNARRPMFMSVGEFRPKAHQPLWFSDPKLLYDSHGVAIGPGNGTAEGGRYWLSLYGCLTEHQGKRILWYPDRKHFLLGRYITDELLQDMVVPE